MAVDAKSSIAEFLSATGARQPAPGGGSVAALVGALSAALGEMVLNYSIGKKDLAQHDASLKAAIHDLTRARDLMLMLMVEDQEAFAAHAAAKKLPVEDPKRAQQLIETLATSIRVPQTVGAAAVAVLRLCQQLVAQVNRYLLSDLAICAELAMTTVRCAAYNVWANLPEITDAAQRDELSAGVKLQIADAVARIRDIDARIWQQVGTK